jgi:hypothetical protein
VAASATELAHPGVAQATGVAWQTGVVNSDNQTFVEPANSSFPDPTLLAVRMGTAPPYQGLTSANQAAIAAYDTTTAGAYGMYATSSKGHGVFGAADTGNGVHGNSNGGFGVLGQSVSNTGVGATSTFGDAVFGTSFSGRGVAGVSSTGIGGAFAGGRAPLSLGLGVGVGAPTSNTHNPGELYLDSAATLWVCTLSGTPGTWVRLVSMANGVSGGSPAFLSAPIRIFDTRSSQPAPLPTSKHPLASGSTTTIQVTGTTVGGLSVPPGAVAVIGNLTVTNTQGGGALILYPHGAARPLTSNINYAGGATLANFANVGLSTGGAMDLFVVGSGTDALFDVAGFIF